MSLTLWDCDANPLLCVWSLGKGLLGVISSFQLPN